MIVIGDVHGEYDTLLKLIKLLPQTEDLCFVGDLIDRGKDSKKVIDFIRENDYHSILGNHETMILNKDWVVWTRNGGNETLESFGGKLPIEYVEWMDTLPLFIEWENYLISHSYAYDGDKTDPDDILWGRDFSIDSCEKINIFGHTPVKNPVQIFDKHWCIDTGCTYGNKLSAIDLTTEKIYSVDKVEG